MTFRGKIILAIFLVFLLAYAASDQLAKYFVYRQFDNLATSAALRDTRRALYFLDDTFSLFDEKVHDWATWDDTYRFIKDRNQAYERSTLLGQAFDNININVIVYLNAAGQVVYSRGYDTDVHREYALPSGDEAAILRAYAGPLSGGKHGLLRCSRGVMLVDARPILKSDGTGPARGTLVMGRYFDNYEMGRLISITHLFANSYFADQPDLPAEIRDRLPDLARRPILLEPINRNRLVSYLLVDDLFGRPALVLRLETESEIKAAAEYIYRLLSFVRLISYILAGLVIMLCLELFVVSYVKRANTALKNVVKKCSSLQGAPNSAIDEVAQLKQTSEFILEKLECPSAGHDEKGCKPA